ncbi:pectate lyase [uncultured Microbulbifer sp.]|uniref:pectate lyase n=1 Tax=uncultured Microbulbifer sp. TaxID=348147 RepID=UPI00260E9363|nr:pectate lyase [uncultured Microbulbifer sp.]
MKFSLRLVPALVAGTLMTISVFGCSARPSPLDQLQPASNMDEYRAISERLDKIDQAVIKAEAQLAGLDEPLKPKKAKGFGFDAEKAATDSAFFATPEGRQIAENLLSFQTPSGGWSKRTDMGVPREKGYLFGVEKNYVPTFDNLATSTQFWVMVNACNALDEARYCDSAARALKYILIAQYPNGGWPQTFPLRGRYHDYITYNDTAITSLLTIVAAAATDDPRLAFVSDDLRELSVSSLQRALKMVAATQVEVNGKPAIWGAQHHADTFEPAAARAFEPVALATSESADLVLFLMTLEHPPTSIQESIENAIAWFESHRIDGLRYRRGGRLPSLVPEQGADPLWARFYDIDSDRPVFGDRDGAVYFDVDDVSEERRQGYAWYTEQPYKVLKQYRKWKP